VNNHLCTRCSAPAGTHHEWCTLSRLIERFLPPPPPPPLDRDALAAMVTQAARDAAREAVTEAMALAVDAARQAAREAVTELLGIERQHLQPVPPSPPEPPAEPTPEPEPPAESQPPADGGRERVRDRRSPATLEAEAAADLFVQEVVTPGEGWVSSPDLAATYEAWRPTIDAPPIHAQFLGAAMRRAGYAKRQAVSSDGAAFKGRGTPKPILYLGARLREAEAPSEDHTSEPCPTPSPPPSPAAEPPTKVRARKYPDGYAGDRPGREIPRDYVEQIVMPLIARGWTYHRNNANKKGKPRMISPDGARYALANTPSDWRGLENAKSHLRRYLGASL
jgi:hypothetical protein